MTLWTLMIGVAVAPFVLVAGVWAERWRSGEYRRLWRPFERALATGRPPGDTEATEWAEFVAARRLGHQRAVAIELAVLVVYGAVAVSGGELTDPFRLATMALIGLCAGQMAVRLRRIDRLAANSAVAPSAK
ncbi:hypothetical protein ACFXHA_00100 [Nocardia sp. NPDC059240]|uniref:hypothetical protein n=1 Tax=Nocardia sp. NPDC059240 TaxID=3346786 RepID=UPI0036A85452